MGKLSYSTAVADAFVEAYKKSHPKDQVKTIDLFSAKLPEFDFIAASGKYKIMRGQPHSPEEKQAWDKVVATIAKFKDADKYVLAVPMWNFSIPYRLKQYFDVIVQPGQTFSVDAAGNYKGLVTGKPVLVVYARGGDYTKGTPAEQYDQQSKYVEAILRYIGFADIKTLAVEPTLAGGPEIAEQKRNAAIEKAKQMAGEF
jgi:FMN-dependent NADH-azoreductase